MVAGLYSKIFKILPTNNINIYYHLKRVVCDMIDYLLFYSTVTENVDADIHHVHASNVSMRRTYSRTTIVSERQTRSTDVQHVRSKIKSLCIDIDCNQICLYISIFETNNFFFIQTIIIACVFY